MSRLYPVRRSARSDAPKRNNLGLPALTFTVDVPPAPRVEWLPFEDIEAEDVATLPHEDRVAFMAEMGRRMCAIEDGEIVSIDPAHGIQSTEVAA